MFDPYSTNRTIRIYFWKVCRSIPPAAFQLKYVENTPLLNPEERKDTNFSNCKKDLIFTRLFSHLEQAKTKHFLHNWLGTDH